MELWLHLSKKPLSQLILGCSLSAAYVPLLGYTCHHSVSCCQTALWPVCISSFLEALQAGYRYRTQHTFTEWAIKASAAGRNTFCFVLNWSQTGQPCWIDLIHKQNFLYLFYASISPTGQRIALLHEWMTTWTFCCSLITAMFNHNMFNSIGFFPRGKQQLACLSLFPVWVFTPAAQSVLASSRHWGLS